MPDKAHNETNEILSRLEANLTASYTRVQRDVLREISPLLYEMYLDNEEATQRERLKRAEKDGNLKKAVAIFASRIIIENESSINRINKDMDRIYYANYSWAVKYIKRMSGVDIEKDLAPDISRATRRAYDKAKDAKYVSDEILKSLKDGIKKGESVPNLSKRVRSTSNKSKNSAKLIARTETTRYQNTARLDSFDNAEKLGIRINKQWYATEDSRTRDSHAALHGETVGQNDAFSNGMEYPGDPSGGASEVCNCRCVLRPIVLGV